MSHLAMTNMRTEMTELIYTHLYLFYWDNPHTHTHAKHTISARRSACHCVGDSPNQLTFCLRFLFPSLHHIISSSECPSSPPRSHLPFRLHKRLPLHNAPTHLSGWISGIHFEHIDFPSSHYLVIDSETVKRLNNLID